MKKNIRITIYTLLLFLLVEIFIATENIIMNLAATFIILFSLATLAEWIDDMLQGEKD